MLTLQLIPGALSEIFATVCDTGILTLGDRYGLMAAILDENLGDNERRAVNRILRAVRRGKIQFAAI
ncbi:MAG: hypothetical protein J7647_19395 [Cyanobacteria bacterium SBLK]|nr:hypothetical protein [Cyanobacteria bacterium SBLK]